MRSKLIGPGFIVLSCISIGAVETHSHWKNLFVNEGKVSRLPYMMALVQGQHNLTQIQRKVNQLPGVASVDINKGAKVKNRLMKELSKEVLESFGSILDQHYQSFKIQFLPNISPKGHSLIKEYLVRLLGKDTISVSDVKRPKGGRIHHTQLAKFIKAGGDFFILFAICALWGFSGVLFIRELKKQAYLIEKFQRKEYVAFKSFVGGMLCIVVFMQASLYFSGHFDLAYGGFIIALIALMSVLTSKKVKMAGL